MATFTLSKPFIHAEGRCWYALIPVLGDNMETLNQSPLELYEDGKLISPSHELHANISATGGFCHWNENVFFSSSDGSDPNTNGRAYIAKYPDKTGGASEKRTVIRNSNAEFSKSLIVKFFKNLTRDAEAELYKLTNSISMLHPEVLAIYELAAAKSPGRVAEIGAYIGGGTVCLAKYAKKQVIVIEPGGAYSDHPSVPSDNILADLRFNLRKFGVTDNVQLIPTYSSYPETIDWLAQSLDGVPITTLVVDADGTIARDLRNVAHLLSKNCVLIIDDYISESTKGVMIKPVMDALVKAKQVEVYGIYGHGTWVGRCTGKLDLSGIE